MTESTSECSLLVSTIIAHSEHHFPAPSEGGCRKPVLGVCDYRGLPVPNSPYGLCGRKTTLNEQRPCNRAQDYNSTTVNQCGSELWSCVKVDVAVLGSSSLKNLVFVVKQH